MSKAPSYSSASIARHAIIANRPVPETKWPPVHLHRDDVPEALSLLNTLLGGRDPLPAGYTPDGTGADVEWELLADSYLSSSEKALVYIPHGLAILEGHGGKFDLQLRDQILAAVQTIVEVP